MSPGESFLLFAVAPLVGGMACLIPLSMRLKREARNRHRAEFKQAIGDRLRTAEVRYKEDTLPATEGKSGGSPISRR